MHGSQASIYGGGHFEENNTVSQPAIACVLAHTGATVVICGASKPDRIEESASWRLSDEELDELAQPTRFSMVLIVNGFGATKSMPFSFSLLSSKPSPQAVSMIILT